MKNVYIIVEIEDVIGMIDDHLVAIQTMKANRYVQKNLSDLEFWEKKLITIQNVIDAWLAT